MTDAEARELRTLEAITRLAATVDDFISGFLYPNMMLFQLFFIRFSYLNFLVFLTIGAWICLPSNFPQHLHRHAVFRRCFQDELGIGGPAFDFLAEVGAQLCEVVG